MGAAPVLNISLDGETIQELPLDGEALIGRSDACVVRLEDRAISREHALFRKVGEAIQVERRSLFAPLLVNGVECTTAVVKEGDVIAIGPYRLRLRGQQAEGAATAAASAAPDAAPAGASPDQPEGLPLQNIEAIASPGEGIPTSELQFKVDGLQSVGQDGPLQLQAPAEDGSEDAATRIFTEHKLAASLLFKPGDANVTEYGFEKDETSLGRGKDCDIVLNDKKASRRNSVIIRDGSAFRIRDLKSSNGTYVNGNPVTERELSGEDRIRIGDTEFVFKALQANYAEQERNFLAVPLLDGPGPEELPPFELGAEVAAARGLDPGQLVMPPAATPPPRGPQGTESGPFGLGSIAGISPAAAKHDKGIMARFRKLSKRGQYAVIALVILGCYFFLFDDDEQPRQAQRPRPAAASGVTGGSGAPAARQLPDFNALSPEQRSFVEAQHELAFNLYKNKEYDKALFEIGKVFALVQDYKDSREIERYAKEGKRKLEALAEEKRRREEDAALKKQIADLIDDARDKMDHKKYEQAQETFAQILALDPENAQVAQWQNQLREIAEEQQAEGQKKAVRAEVDKEAWIVYRKGAQLKDEGKLHDAIRVLDRVKDIDSFDGKLDRLAASMIANCKTQIQAQLKPVLADAKSSEDQGDYVKAMDGYQKAYDLDPANPEARDGMARVRGLLHERAKAFYTEAILAESYSDFATAKRKYQDCLTIAPKDDVYRDRSERKLARFFKSTGDTPPQ